MNKKVESALFIAVAVAVILSLRFALAHMDRTSREYEYASSLNLEQQTTQVAENPQEDTKKDENLDDTEEPEEDQGDESHDDLREDQENDESADNGASQNVSDDSSAGNGNGQGDGDGAGNGTPGPVSATPVPSQAPQTTQGPSATQKPDATVKPDGTVKSIKVSWPTKDDIFYDEDLKERKKKIVVTAVYSSGEEKTLEAGDYQIRGLSSTSKGCGQHTMTVSYGDLECQLEYTVNDWVKGIYLEWSDAEEKVDNGMRLYKGEMIFDEVFFVYAKMASSGKGDENDVDLYYGEYDVKGIDPNKTGVVQNFKVTYQGFEATGSCKFNERVKTTHIIYCNDAAHNDVVAEETQTETINVKYNKDLKILPLGDVSEERDGKTYTLSEQLIVDGRSRSLPYTLKYDNRELNIDLYQYYVYDRSKNIDSIKYEWKGKASEDGILDKDTSFASQIKIIAVMENGDEKELKYSACDVTGLDEALVGEKQTFKITYKDWSVSGTCKFQ